jgi:predicted DNA-binding transcriptional regulator YafY
MIRLLSGRPGKTVAQLALLLDTSQRSVYRYIALLEEIGYLVDTDAYGRYFLFQPEKPRRAEAFGPEESLLLRQLLESAAAAHPLKEGILHKLYLHSDYIPLAENILKVHTAKVVAKLSEAIQERRQVRLLNYHSTNSETYADRLVEPLEFTENFAVLQAYEPAAGKVKSYKVERIQDVQVLDVAGQYDQTAGGLDFFGMSGPEPIPVTLRLTARAYRLLIEEYPLTRPYTRREGTDYVFEGTVRNWQGIGRFVLGLINEVKGVEPKELRLYIIDTIKNVNFTI